MGVVGISLGSEITDPNGINERRSQEDYQETSPEQVSEFPELLMEGKKYQKTSTKSIHRDKLFVGEGGGVYDVLLTECVCIAQEV